MANSSGIHTHVIPPSLSRAIFTTPAAGEDAPSEVARESNFLTRAKDTFCSLSCQISTSGGRTFAELNLPKFTETEW